MRRRAANRVTQQMAVFQARPILPVLGRCSPLRGSHSVAVRSRGRSSRLDMTCWSSTRARSHVFRWRLRRLDWESWTAWLSTTGRRRTPYSVDEIDSFFIIDGDLTAFTLNWEEPVDSLLCERDKGGALHGLRQLSRWADRHGPDLGGGGGQTRACFVELSYSIARPRYLGRCRFRIRCSLHNGVLSRSVGPQSAESTEAETRATLCGAAGQATHGGREPGGRRSSTAVPAHSGPSRPSEHRK